MIVKDASHFQGEAQQILTPSTEKEIARILREANAARTPVTASGAGTGLTGARVPQKGILLSTERMNRILQIDWDGRSPEGSVLLEPGVSLRDLETALKAKGLFYPPNPGEKKAFIGGTVATNASGSRSFKYGATRPFVKRLRVLLADGDLLEIARGHEGKSGDRLEIRTAGGKQLSIPIPDYSMPKVKNAAGYYAKPGMDLIDLFIGSEGTLGVFTRIELKVIPAPEAILGGVLFFDSEGSCFRFVEEVRKSHSLDPRALEFFDSKSLELLLPKHPRIPAGAKGALYFEQECRSPERESARQAWIQQLDRSSGFVPDPWLSVDPKEQEAFRQFRYDLPALVNERATRNGFRKMGTDLAVPDEGAKEMLDFYLMALPESGIPYCLFGHIGENHLHANLRPKTQAQLDQALALYEQLARKAISLGGTVSAEHGIGKLRIPYLEMMVGKEGLRQMARVKLALDPNGILNPGNIIPMELLGSDPAGSDPVGS